MLIDFIGQVRRAPGATRGFSSDSAMAGWLADADNDPSAEDIETHLAEMSSTDAFIVPGSIVDEVVQVCDRRGISAMPDNADVACPGPRH